MKLHKLIFALMTLTGIFAPVIKAQAADERPVAHKILIFGDSTTGRLGERLNAWGELNGFEVATVCWDGATYKKWAESARLPQIIEEVAPDAIFISLGANSLGTKDPEKKIKDDYEALLQLAGNTPVIWIGPPAWHNKTDGLILCEWMESTAGEHNFFNSFDLELQRTSAKNPHPTRAGSAVWMDAVIEWLKDNGAVTLPGYEKPEEGAMSKGEYYIYKRMKETM